MRLAILSDIHGNLTALNAVIDDMTTQAVDHVVVLGDNAFLKNPALKNPALRVRYLHPLYHLNLP